MRTLFTKIFLWFVATVALTFTITVYLSAAFSGQQPEYNRLTFEQRQARRAWETGGQAGLQRFLNEFRDASQVDAVLADAHGRDLITGHDWSREISQGTGARGIRPFFYLMPFIRLETGKPFTLVTTTRDRKYNFLVVFPEHARNGWVVQVRQQTWWVLGIFAVLCYGLARQLTAPLRRTQKTIERLGHGDLSARVNARRADELGQLGNAVDQMADRIEGLVKSQRRLLQDISHELRSPLARLGVAVELGRSGGSAATAFARIEKEADRLNALVGELIQVTRAEGDPSGMPTEPVRLDELAGGIVDDVRIEAERRGVDLRTAFVEAELSANPELLRRAVENVLRNAIRYSPEGGRIEIGLSRTDHPSPVWRISVRDFGAGVPPDSLEHLFDPFYRVETDRGRSSGGVGLGLAIAKRAVELHHGVMRATNSSPGLLVEIELPAPAAAVELQPEMVGV